MEIWSSAPQSQRVIMTSLFKRLRDFIQKQMFQKRPSGLIRFYGLTDWWLNTFSAAERKIISSTFQPLDYSKSILTNGEIGSLSGSAVSLLSNLARWFMKEQTRTIAYRM